MKTKVHRHIRRTKHGRTIVKKHTRKLTNRSMGVYVYRKSLGGMHTGDITNPEIAQAYGTTPYPEKDVDTEEKQLKLAIDLIRDDLESGKNDIEEVRVTDKGDLMLMHYDAKKGTTTLSGDIKDTFERAFKSKKNRDSKFNRGSTDIFSKEKGFIFSIPTVDTESDKQKLKVGEALVFNEKGELTNINPLIWQQNKKSGNTRLADKYATTDYYKLAASKGYKDYEKEGYKAKE